MHSTRRWNRDHSDELQSAWMNGTGMLVWDTVFGVWVGWNERDKATLPRMLRVQRAFSDLLIEGDWSPLEGATAEAVDAGIYVSRWSQAGTTLWTIVNRSERDWAGDALAAVPGSGTRRFDVTAGAADVRSVKVPARGAAGILQLEPDIPEPAGLAALMAAAAADTGSADTRFPHRQAIRITPRPAKVDAFPAAAIVLDPGTRTLEVTFRRRETGFYQGAPYVEEWKPLPPRLHDRRSEQLSVAIDRTVAVAPGEVSVEEFRDFILRTGYRPNVGTRFLSGTEGAANDAPVTGVSLADARAYAAWAGARLPNEFEWQLAAKQPGFARRIPAVWNWTESEHSYGITRFLMLKGEATTSPQAPTGTPTDAFRTPCSA
ncbi:SUMF1/EgtB/PvdO family nonheme iron enzyme [Arthrobacter sp. BE255]|uniref:SUMF1/EgtB/PvdO family nonheme iron enzyme n=1 Tax=Arthrobacter sp. BE255 TaxID=2817721 RepID=UPI00286B22FC|nr:SUMF1/EgtB/PvdO family nonheme iron enzyme [Arthrobacter sp. BE255]